MKVKLIKGLSYRFNNMTATRDRPIIECNSEDAEKLIKSGHFIMCEISKSNDTDISILELQKMKKAELEAIAIKYDIDINECNSNNERATTIYNALMENTEG